MVQRGGKLLETRHLIYLLQPTTEIVARIMYRFGKAVLIQRSDSGTKVFFRLSDDEHKTCLNTNFTFSSH
jgi:hypothetical protein